MIKNSFSDKELRKIQFHSEGIVFKFKRKKMYRLWLLTVAKAKNYKIDYVNYVFCNDDFLVKINQEFLNHDTLTDIITFEYTDDDKKIKSDIYISIERVLENAATNGVDFATELKRVMVHGLLHLCGYSDKTEEETLEMTKQENLAIQMLQIN